MAGQEDQEWCPWQERQGLEATSKSGGTMCRVRGRLGFHTFHSELRWSSTTFSSPLTPSITFIPIDQSSNLSLIFPLERLHPGRGVSSPCLVSGSISRLGVL